MRKRRSYEIKERILWVVKEKPATYAQLERRVNTGFRSIRDNVEELERYGQVVIERIERHPANGRPSQKVSISAEGLKRLKERKRAVSS